MPRQALRPSSGRGQTERRTTITTLHSGRDLEADVLLCIARLPLITASDLARALWADTDDVRRALEALLRHGWIERLRLHPANQPGAIEAHVLREVAIPAFSQTFGLDEDEVRRGWPVRRGDALDRIAALEITQSINRFLAGVARDYPVDAEPDPDDELILPRLVDCRALPRRRQGDFWWLPLMDGYGYFSFPKGDRHPFFLAWDRESAPEQHRRARVNAWYRVWEYDDPAILIVCASPHERRQWEEAITRAGRRRQVDPRAAFVYVNDALGDSPTDHCRSLGRDDPWDLSYSVLCPNTLYFNLPKAPRLDLIDRGVAERTPSLDEWARRRLASFRGSARDRAAAVRFTIERLHWQVLSELVRHPYLTAGDLAVRLGEAPERIDQLLSDLDRLDLTASISEGAPSH
ncbi:MAG: hypothetical protein AB7F65_08835 [Dehalococcoidia bacterium]